MVISMTACLDTTKGFPFNVTATAASDSPEPMPAWPGEILVPGRLARQFELSYNTTAIRRQFSAVASATPLSDLDRGIMTLDSAATNWTEYLIDLFLSLTVSTAFQLIHAFPKFPIEVTATPQCIDNPSSDVELPSQSCDHCTTTTDPSSLINSLSFKSPNSGHPVQLALFMDTLVATGSPSRALQAWITSMTRQEYYDALTRFALAGEARYAQSVPRFLSVR